MPVAILVSVNAVAVSAKYFAFIYFCDNFTPSLFGVLANIKILISGNVIEMESRRVRVVSTYCATAFEFYVVYHISPFLLKPPRSSFFIRRIVSAFCATIYRPIIFWGENYGTSTARSASVGHESSPIGAQYIQ
jgi:hypothetical protein